MAAIYEIMIKSVRTFKKDEKNYHQGSVYMDGKRIGFYSDETDVPQNLKFDCGEEGINEFNTRVRQYFNQHNVTDEKRLEEMTAEEYNSLGGKLPVISLKDEKYRGNHDEIIRQFMYNLLLLHKCEREYKKAVKQGCHSIVLIHFLKLNGMVSRDDEIYYVEKKEAEMSSTEDWAVKMYGSDLFPAIIREYASNGDFVIH